MKKLNGFLVNKKVILFLNGESPKVLPDLSIYDKIFCTDGSYNYLKDFNVIPDYITGDFDSFSLDEIDSKIKIVHTPDQNFTDFEKALKYIADLGYTIVDVFGASGKQQDHFIGNLNAALKFINELSIKFYDNYSTYYFIPNVFSIDQVMDKTISLIPFPITNDITTDGLLYPLIEENLDLTNRIGTRNKVIKNTVKINFTSGNLVLFILNE